MESNIKTLLKDFDLRSTDCRSAILEIFLHKNFALSHSDIENKISDSYDRVTVYRTLKTFLDKGIIHKVLDDSGSTKYALCREHCTSAHHNHEHVHFKCIDCGLTNCLDDIEVPAIKLPQGYKILEVNLLVQGVCKKCNS
jgi:Fur family transcriptional regulator, ferric uptake regulator